jgi:hypothetical protein
MAKKKKIKNNWSKLKSIIWREQKERGVYQYNSPNFNKLVSETYEVLGKKIRTREEIGIAYQQTEQRIFEAPAQPEEQLHYYNINRYLEDLQSIDFYSGYTIITNFGGAVPDAKIPLSEYEYKDSPFYTIIGLADQMRRDKKMTTTPEAKLKVDIDNKNQLIKVYVADAPPPQTGKRKRRKKKYVPIAKTPSQIEGIVKGKKDAEQKLNKVKENLETLEVVVKRIAETGDTEFIKLSQPFIKKYRTLLNEQENIKSEIKNFDKFLSGEGAKGFKKPTKKSTKKRTKSTSPKRKRKR